LHSGPGKRIFLAAFSPADGRTIWSTEEPVEGDGSNTPDKRYFGSWATPVVAKVGGKDQLVLAMPTRVCGYDPEDGKLLWWCEGLRHRGGDLAYSSPLLVDDLCVMTGGFGGPALAFRLGASGDLTAKRLWRTERSPQSIGTGVVVGKHVYRPNAGPGTIDCLDPANGKVLWSHRAAGEQWSSMVRVGDHVYSTAQNGGVVVFRPDPAKYDQIARSELGDATNATPAAVDGMLVFRGQKRLICVGK
ncbi:MAG TPA: PQQ-binding-like beta-propeller repeat protein, partial [Planctomycetia bacterium]|nr:PQQ-binding-like beta-propeller repeat protein [Planctomycetia bacterium]